MNMNTEDVVESLMDLAADSVSLVDGVRKFDDLELNSGEEGFVLYTVDGGEFHVQVAKAR
jgi:hypothetical protein